MIEIFIYFVTVNGLNSNFFDNLNREKLQGSNFTSVGGLIH